jgi:hypothetical protein
VLTTPVVTPYNKFLPYEISYESRDKVGQMYVCTEIQVRSMYIQSQFGCHRHIRSVSLPFRAGRLFSLPGKCTVELHIVLTYL